MSDESKNGAEGGGVGKALREAVRETFSATPEVFFSRLGAVGVDSRRFYDELPHIAGLGCMIRDRTEGRVSLGDAGRAKVRYALVDEDLERLLKGV